MVQKSFGRRSGTADAVPQTPAISRENEGRSAAKSGLVLAAVGVGVLTLAFGGALALNSGSDAVSAAATQQAAPAPQECRGNDHCGNLYDVTLRCGDSEKQRTVSVSALASDAAERKAERYNRGCRSAGSKFVASFVRTAASSVVRKAAGSAARRAVAADAPRKTTAGGRRFRLRRQ